MYGKTKWEVEALEEEFPGHTMLNKNFKLPEYFHKMHASIHVRDLDAVTAQDLEKLAFKLQKIIPGFQFSKTGHFLHR